MHSNNGFNHWWSWTVGVHELQREDDFFFLFFFCRNWWRHTRSSGSKLHCIRLLACGKIICPCDGKSYAHVTIGCKNCYETRRKCMLEWQLVKEKSYGNWQTGNANQATGNHISRRNSTFVIARGEVIADDDGFSGHLADGRRTSRPTATNKLRLTPHQLESRRSRVDERTRCGSCLRRCCCFFVFAGGVVWCCCSV